MTSHFDTFSGRPVTFGPGHTLRRRGTRNAFPRGRITELTTTAIGIFLTKTMHIDTGAGGFVADLSVALRIGGAR